MTIRFAGRKNRPARLAWDGGRFQPGEESVWHAVRSDEVWFWHRGGPLTLVLGGDGDRPGIGQEITLGPGVEQGQVPQALVPAGTWQAARRAGDQEVLVSCVVSPGFDFADFTAL
ncbi:hypothetical protein Sme01_09730 [Sphaerisporangium melleum]|uniref:DUF985 domain-containing protein n=1 Tax=Sphaerisporangium melleum TaxID=321316 RepID=A0A917QTZ6_9ACTN|nr:cupin domain-containing protein [Sphaerisporangium melleum]GGK67263.1 hypothetical protein GCM10007964_07880 [Sphaerisporangium melleum]GII68497.1 hypothetical protein Sme01_09730 [Sphaerisporangium melleum]